MAGTNRSTSHSSSASGTNNNNASGSSSSADERTLSTSKVLTTSTQPEVAALVDGPMADSSDGGGDKGSVDIS